MGGIYFIICIVNNKKYIGSAKNLYSRWRSHVKQLTIGKHCNRHLQNAWDKYGAQNFKFEILEHLGEYDKCAYFSRENYWIDEHKLRGEILFNIARAEGGWGDDTKSNSKTIGQKISCSLKLTYGALSEDERKAKFGHFRGTHLSDERKLYLSQYWAGKRKSDETRAKMKQAQMNIPESLRESKRQAMSELGKRRKGKSPSNAKPIYFQGILYNSAPECQRKTGLSMHIILKEVYGPNYRKKEKKI